MRYAPEAHHDLDLRCLPGTRMEIIQAIIHWALGADLPPSALNNLQMLKYSASARVLWVCGTAGSGKTSILRSCATTIGTMGRCGAFYGFGKNQPAASISALFSTIARDLADLDPTRKHQLVEVIKNDNAKRTTSDCKLQFQYHIITPAIGVMSIGETVIFIDAFDESGSFEERRQLLHILTERASELPSGLRIVITSRYERDVQDALESPLPGVDVMRMQDVAETLTIRDIDKYVKASLWEVKQLRAEKYHSSLDQLVGKAGTSFQWAATACRFIKSENSGGVDPREQLENVLKSDHGLDALYTTIMAHYFNPTDALPLARLKSVLGRILSAREPLPL